VAPGDAASLIHTAPASCGEAVALLRDRVCLDRWWRACGSMPRSRS